MPSAPGGGTDVSAYHVNKICHRVLHDRAFREAMRVDPGAAIHNLPLTNEERALLLAGDVAGLYKLGALPFLLQHLARFEVLGLNLLVYNERMISVTEPVA